MHADAGLRHEDSLLFDRIVTWLEYLVQRLALIFVQPTDVTLFC